MGAAAIAIGPPSIAKIVSSSNWRPSTKPAARAGRPASQTTVASVANQLAMHQSIEAANDGSATLVPVILADCELPLLSRFRVPLDFRNQEREHWEAEAARIRKKLAAPAPELASAPCPDPGARPFTTVDAARFHGRNKEVADLLGRLRDGQRELYVIGPAGSGKSSLVAAGLVPNLRRSPELAGGSFLVRQMRPGGNPDKCAGV